ncbi:hypothetical protein LINPERHAP2_LOCUS39442 [Linum perenne]
MSTDVDLVVPLLWSSDDDDVVVINISSDVDDKVVEVINIESDVEVIDIDLPTLIRLSNDDVINWCSRMHFKCSPFIENFCSPDKWSMLDFGGDSPPNAWLLVR